MYEFAIMQEFQGRTLMLQCECGRCGKKHIEPFKSYTLPKGWRECDKKMPILCPECHKSFNDFMNGGRNR
jgi:hypothetical protein